MGLRKVLQSPDRVCLVLLGGAGDHVTLGRNAHISGIENASVIMYFHGILVYGARGNFIPLVRDRKTVPETRCTDVDDDDDVGFLTSVFQAVVWRVCKLCARLNYIFTLAAGAGARLHLRARVSV